MWLRMGARVVSGVSISFPFASVWTVETHTGKVIGGAGGVERFSVNVKIPV